MKINNRQKLLAAEYTECSICPVCPHPAIYIEGSEHQLIAAKPKEAEKFTKKVEDFGF